MWHSTRVPTILSNACMSLHKQRCSMKSAWVPAPADLMSPMSYWPTAVCHGMHSKLFLHY